MNDLAGGGPEIITLAGVRERMAAYEEECKRKEKSLPKTKIIVCRLDADGNKMQGSFNRSSDHNALDDHETHNSSDHDDDKSVGADELDLEPDDVDPDESAYFDYSARPGFFRGSSFDDSDEENETPKEPVEKTPEQLAKDAKEEEVKKTFTILLEKEKDQALSSSQAPVILQSFSSLQKRYLSAVAELRPENEDTASFSGTAPSFNKQKIKAELRKEANRKERFSELKSCYYAYAEAAQDKREEVEDICVEEEIEKLEDEVVEEWVDYAEKAVEKVEILVAASKESGGGDQTEATESSEGDDEEDLAEMEKWREEAKKLKEEANERKQRKAEQEAFRAERKEKAKERAKKRAKYLKKKKEMAEAKKKVEEEAAANKAQDAEAEKEAQEAEEAKKRAEAEAAAEAAAAEAATVEAEAQEELEAAKKAEAEAAKKAEAEAAKKTAAKRAEAEAAKKAEAEAAKIAELEAEHEAELAEEAEEAKKKAEAEAEEHKKKADHDAKKKSDHEKKKSEHGKKKKKEEKPKEEKKKKDKKKKGDEDGEKKGDDEVDKKKKEDDESDGDDAPDEKFPRNLDGSIWKNVLKFWSNKPKSVKEKSSKVIITTTPGSDCFRPSETSGNDSASFYWHKVDGDFDCVVHIKGEFARSYDKAGIMLRLDEKTWMMSGVEYFGEQLNNASCITREISDWSLAPLPDAKKGCWFCVKRVGNKVESFYSMDTKNWIQTRQGLFTDAPTLKVGIATGSPTGEGFKVTFDRFWMKKK